MADIVETNVAGRETGEVALPVRGMSCASCVARVEGVLEAIPGVVAATVNLAAERATIVFDNETVTPDGIATAIGRAGFEVPSEVIELAVTGMSCASCVARLEAALRRVPGVTSAEVNLATERAHVATWSGRAAASALVAAAEEAGFGARETSAAAATKDLGAAERDEETRELLRRVLLAAGFCAPLVLVAMLRMIEPFHAWMLFLLAERGWVTVELILASPVLFLAGSRIYRTGWAELRHLNPGMNTLVMLGASAAYAYSLAALTMPGVFPAGTVNAYFEAAGVIVTLVLLGRYLEAVARNRTSDAVRKLIGLQPQTARVTRNGAVLEVPVDAVRQGDVITLKPGERIPVDGRVTDGSSWVDESMITGEAVPANKTAGDEVIGGTVNKAGSLTISASRVGDDTVLARIIRMVEQAQAVKPPAQKLADRIALVFVPAVIAAAALTFAGWILLGSDQALSFAFVTSVSVLLIACPCAMGLATPTAIMAATGRGAETGILFRNGTALETLARIDMVVFDKTGTLTAGRPEVSGFRVLAKDDFGMDPDSLLRLVASAEAGSEHPVAEAIVAEARARGQEVLPARDFTADPGYGIAARVDCRMVRAGNLRLMTRLGVEMPDAAEQIVADFAARGETPVFAAVDDRLVAVFSVSDGIKPGCAEALQALGARGIDIGMLTGDDRRTAAAVAAELGISAVHAELLPEQKADLVKRLKAEGRRVAFVGDGINDAPALASADVGIAIGTGTDIAIEAGDVVLMSGELDGIAGAVRLAVQTRRTILLNFVWAYAYNVALIPLAAGLLYPLAGILLNPMLAAGAMSVSSLFVVGNSLLLRRRDIRT